MSRKMFIYFYNRKLFFKIIMKTCYVSNEEHNFLLYFVGTKEHDVKMYE